MSLLRDIQEAAIDEQSQVATLLRKCKVLATRIGSEEFTRWIDNELNGYANLDDLPAYRVLNVRSYGHFVGYFGQQVKNAPIPPGALPKEIREYVQTSKINMSISALANLSGGDEDPREGWPPDVLSILGGRIYEDMNCISAWKTLPRAALISILDTVRTRVLNFALEIESEYPDAGEAPINSNPIPEEKVSQVFNTYITGTVQNLATGSNNVKQKASLSTGPSDEMFVRLLDAVSNASAEREAIEKMAAIVEEMRGSRGTLDFKAHYHTFMGILADHMQVFGPVVAQFLPALAQMAS
jgi:hypothetical protein